MKCYWQTGYHQRGNMTRLTRMRGRPKRSYRRASSLNFSFSSASESTVTSCFGHCAKGQISKSASTDKPRAHVKDDTSILGQSTIFLPLENELFTYDSITVSSPRELISVSMCYSQGGGANSPLSRLCTVPTSGVRLCSIVFVPDSFLVLCGYLPWHGHVLPGTKVRTAMCVNQLYKQG